ncbi:GNAT family N-acetyltransferase [Bacillus sp. AGMB 02131]|uniref:GNAT family N-acetyltransferase n=1 Tax=Peribacillus faecalis TaxID=2772559 RepID=A0A927CUT8_9BACI|nr:GNAT family N-acetyltransferase [Peribacillus faecalis]MBD3107471.1 GNAT family N-acetyltransferase [Peribacillus faecalis]
MKIRILQPSDAVQYQSLRLAALQTNPEAFGASYEEEVHFSTDRFGDRLQSANVWTFGAFEQEKLIGSATLLRETKIKLQHKANIYAVYVTPEKRGLGIGRSLIEEAIRKARAINGVEQLNLSVVTTNTAALKLYELLGFQTFGHEKHALKIAGTYFDEQHMVLFL